MLGNMRRSSVTRPFRLNSIRTPGIIVRPEIIGVETARDIDQTRDIFQQFLLGAILRVLLKKPSSVNKNALARPAPEAYINWKGLSSSLRPGHFSCVNEKSSHSLLFAGGFS